MIKGIKPPSASDNSLNSRINYIDNAKMQVTFDGSCLKQKKKAHLTLLVLTGGKYALSPIVFPKSSKPLAQSF